MRKFLKNSLLLFFLLHLFNLKNTHAQTSLGLGDIAFVSINVDDSTSSIKDPFQIMFLKAITAGTQISFTDRAYTDAGGFAAGTTTETVFTWRATTSYAVGDILMFWSSGSSGPYTANAESGVIDAGDGISLTSVGEQIFAFQGSAINYDSLITGIHTNVTVSTTDANWDDNNSTSNSTSELPDILTNGVNALRVHDSGTELDNWGYDCSTVSGTASALRTAINNVANWNGDNTAIFTYKCAAPTSTTWNGSTWSNGSPSSTVDAVIASSTTPGSFTCKDLTINSTFSLTIGSGVTATIHGNVTNSGNGTSGVGALNFSGTSQSLSGNAFTHNGAVEVNTGATLTTNNLLTIGNGGSLMHGTSTPNGGGSITGNITFEKTLGSTTDGWRSFALPVDALIDGFETGLNTRCSNSSPSDRWNVYYWDGSVRGGSINSVANGWASANGSTDDENKGYAIYLSNASSGFFDFSSTVSISGTPNDGTKTFNLDYTFDPEGDSSTTSQQGWNLIPNYFPSNLRVYDLLNDADFDPTYKAVHIWNQGSSQMVAINQSSLTNYNTSGGSVFSNTRQIPPFMAFWVKANTGSQSVQLKNSMRTSNIDSLPANTYFKTDPDIFRIEVADQYGNMDQFSTAFIDGATHQFDNTYDIYKFKSFSDEVPTLYTKIENDKVSLTAMPIETNYSIPVYIESAKDGREYTVKAITEDYSNYYNVELIDNKTGISTDITEKDYRFNHDANYTKARFTLSFKKKATTGIDELYSQEKSYAYIENNSINIVYQNNNQETKAQIDIYNMMGQKLYGQQNITGGETVNYTPAAQNMQVYIIKVQSNGKVNTIKVVN